jgi:hypothetical protein
VIVYKLNITKQSLKQDTIKPIKTSNRKTTRRKRAVDKFLTPEDEEVHASEPINNATGCVRHVIVRRRSDNLPSLKEKNNSEKTLGTKKI